MKWFLNKFFIIFTIVVYFLLFPTFIRASSSTVNTDIPFIGAHFLLVDGPTGYFDTILNDIFSNKSSTQAQAVSAFQMGGINALRIYNAYHWSPHGGATLMHNLIRVGEIQNLNPSELASKISLYDQSHVNGFTLLDFASKQNISISLVADTMYYNPSEEKSYFTREVANNQSLLTQAAQRNVGDFVDYYISHNYTFPFIIEIGNENIGYHNDQNPTPEEYAMIVIAYSKIITAHGQGKVKSAFVYEKPAPNRPAKDIIIQNEYNASLLKALNGQQIILDYAVMHPYRAMQNVSYIQPHISNTIADLISIGFTKTKVLITEYNLNLNRIERYSDHYLFSLAQASSILHFLNDPRVGGVFIHAVPFTDSLNLSDGVNWSMNYPSQLNMTGHYPDEIGTLGYRWRVLPYGLFNQLLIKKILTGQIISTQIYTANQFDPTFHMPTQTLFIVDKQTSISYIFINLSDNPQSLTTNVLPVPTGAFIDGEILTSTSDGPPVDDLNQPWKISSFLPSQQVPPNSIIFVTVEKNNSNCLCQPENLCDPVCVFNKLSGAGITYATQFKCTSSLSNSTPALRNAWCRRSTLAQGDADGDGFVSLADYDYYRRSVTLDKSIPSIINADFNGDGEVGLTDARILLTSLGLNK